MNGIQRSNLIQDQMKNRLVQIKEKQLKHFTENQIPYSAYDYLFIEEELEKLPEVPSYIVAALTMVASDYKLTLSIEDKVCFFLTTLSSISGTSVYFCKSTDSSSFMYSSMNRQFVLAVGLAVDGLGLDSSIDAKAFMNDFLNKTFYFLGGKQSYFPRCNNFISNLEALDAYRYINHIPANELAIIYDLSHMQLRNVIKSIGKRLSAIRGRNA